MSEPGTLLRRWEEISSALGVPAPRAVHLDGGATSESTPIGGWSALDSGRRVLWRTVAPSALVSGPGRARREVTPWIGRVGPAVRGRAPGSAGRGGRWCSR